MYLLIVEVSQKQAYIFKSLKLKDNVINSENIAKAVSDEYFKEIEGYSFEENMVYSGGGHTVLQFDDKEKAKEFAKKLTLKARTEFEGMEIFAKLMEYDEKLSPGENIENLCESLEKKKSLRKSAFKRIDFGIDTLTSAEREDNSLRTADETYKDYKLAKEFGDLGGSENESNFIAVVHIDGNSMGDRVKRIREKYGIGNWEDFKNKQREFSESIDKDFKEAFYGMVDVVIDNILNGNLIKLNTQDYLPIRKIILAGDDVCFVCDGRIGLECAYTFMKKLNEKKNAVDGENYYAAAGVCIVHSKFPFYRAYNISEGLCSSAKKLIAKKETQACAIDWHIDFGELEDSVSEIKKDYIADDGTDMLLRPYFVGVDFETTRKYENFRDLICNIANKSEKEFESKGKIKELRNVIREGENETNRYIVFNRINGLFVNSINNPDILKKLSENGFDNLDIKKGVYIEDDLSERKQCVIFDAIESLDTYIKLEGKGL